MSTDGGGDFLFSGISKRTIHTHTHTKYVIFWWLSYTHTHSDDNHNRKSFLPRIYFHIHSLQMRAVKMLNNELAKVKGGREGEQCRWKKLVN